MTDKGFTHLAIDVTNIDDSVAFYERFANMRLVKKNDSTVWLSDGTRPFGLILRQTTEVHGILGPFAHIGIGVDSKESIDRLAQQAEAQGILIAGPKDSGLPVGYWIFISDPDGHTLELSYGQQMASTIQAVFKE